MRAIVQDRFGTAEVLELRTKLADLEPKLTALEKERDDLQKQVRDQDEQVKSLGSQNATLTNELTELKKKAAAVHTTGATETEPEPETQSWMADPVNQRAARMKAPTKK